MCIERERERERDREREREIRVYILSYILPYYVRQAGGQDRRRRLSGAGPPRKSPAKGVPTYVMHAVVMYVYVHVCAYILYIYIYIYIYSAQDERDGSGCGQSVYVETD